MAAAGGAVLLLGGPGVGKSTLGRYLHSRHPTTSRFLSVGDELRSRGLVRLQEEQPTAARREEMRRTARELLRRECSEWADMAAACARAQEERAGRASCSTSPPAPCGAPVLILECVKEIDDAFSVMQLLREAGVPLLQVLYLPANVVSNNDVLWRFILQSPPSPTTIFAPRERERRVQERQAKWAANAGRLIEFFSSLGVLSESFQNVLFGSSLS
ncbi:hypothetical protein PLESTB_000170600 [Pleodorina starrii]|uniref:Uncharacterized protein n=1 Tax=Pleodorina starrii TaxID=330485 RepID=A0A9W6EY86_9CHLO|nr:hypothetical protein PLESTB_000170600 [Pleodorina starrii]GLC66215.1 hypothetical protein PLESTF_000397300 [Pleodorina starrii]